MKNSSRGILALNFALQSFVIVKQYFVNKKNKREFTGRTHKRSIGPTERKALVITGLSGSGDLCCWSDRLALSITRPIKLTAVSRTSITLVAWQIGRPSGCLSCDWLVKQNKKTTWAWRFLKALVVRGLSSNGYFMVCCLKHWLGQWQTVFLAWQILNPDRLVPAVIHHWLLLAVSKGLRRARSALWLAIFCGLSDRLTLSITDFCFSLADINSRTTKAGCPTRHVEVKVETSRCKKIGVLRRARGRRRAAETYLTKRPICFRVFE